MAPVEIESLSPPVRGQLLAQALIAVLLLIWGVALVTQMGITGFLVLGLCLLYAGVAALAQRGSWLSLAVSAGANGLLGLVAVALLSKQWLAWTGAQRVGPDWLDLALAVPAAILVGVWVSMVLREGKQIAQRPWL